MSEATHIIKQLGDITNRDYLFFFSIMLNKRRAVLLLNDLVHVLVFSPKRVYFFGEAKLLFSWLMLIDHPSNFEPIFLREHVFVSDDPEVQRFSDCSRVSYPLGKLKSGIDGENNNYK